MATQVYHHPRPAEKFDTRWEWALDSANKKGFSDGFWMAYSIRHLMGENNFFASTGRYTYHSSYHSLDLVDGKTLEDFAFNDRDTQVQKRAVCALEDLPEGAGIPGLIKIAHNHPNPAVR